MYTVYAFRSFLVKKITRKILFDYRVQRIKPTFIILFIENVSKTLRNLRYTRSSCTSRLYSINNVLYYRLILLLFVQLFVVKLWSAFSLKQNVHYSVYFAVSYRYWHIATGLSNNSRYCVIHAMPTSSSRSGKNTNKHERSNIYHLRDVEQLYEV